jgi:hypothetical protein
MEREDDEEIDDADDAEPIERHGRRPATAGIVELLARVREQLDELQTDAIEADGGNVAAGVRARKQLQIVRRTAVAMRGAILAQRIC